MKTNRLLLLTSIFAFLFIGCEKNPAMPGNESPAPGDLGNPDEPIKTAVYAKGADISWVTQMEKDGVKFYNAEGEETDCFELMKGLGFDAIRLRVWVNPEEGWCGKEDVLEKAARAYNLGMRLMIDFHYSDTWADPGTQNPPAAWKNYTVEEMTSAVSAHTKDVLSALSDLGIGVEWVQIGNEVNNGMLHPLGKVQNQTADDFVRFVNAGSKVVKNIYPDAKVIIHVSNGHDQGLFEWFFSLMQANSAKYDIIGMSLYPSWWENGGWSNWKNTVDRCISNIKGISQMYTKPVILCEFGMPVSEPETTKEAIQYLLDKTKDMKECQGVFYWEPQTDGEWKPESYNSLGWNAYDMGAFQNGKPTVALDPFKI